MTNRAVEEVDRRIRDLETRLARLRKIKELVANDPAMGDELLSIVTPSLNGSQQPVVVQPQVRRYNSPLLEQVVAHFQSEQNRWQTVREISDAIGLSRNSLNGLLYTSRHKELFETQMEGPKRRVFRLKPPAETEPPAPPNGGMRSKNRPAGYPKDKPWPPGIVPAREPNTGTPSS